VVIILYGKYSAVLRSLFYTGRSWGLFSYHMTRCLISLYRVVLRTW